ncbi:MAG: hypothetical protein ACOZQL_31770 [Myxococcota bacterium]
MKELETALREGGEKVGEGRIRIDGARALQRLRDFRFADPAHWVLEVLRAAVLSGARQVSVTTDADDVIVEFDGQPFPEDLLRNLLERALEPGETDDERRARLLALGVVGALGTGAVFVTVDSGAHALRLTPQQVVLSPRRGRGTRVHLRKAFGWRVVAGFVRGAPEAKAVLARAPRLPAKLTLNGAAASKLDAKGAPVFAGTGDEVHRVLSGDGWRAEVLVPRAFPRTRSLLELDVAGVTVAPRVLELPGLQVRGWLRADQMRRNASGSDVVDDDPLLREATKALQRLSRELFAELAPKLVGEKPWRRAFVNRLVEGEPDTATRTVLQSLPLVPGPAGEFYPLAAFEDSMRRDGCISVADRPWKKGTYPEPTALVLVEPALDALLPKGKRVDVARLVAQRERIAENRARVEANPVEPATLSGAHWELRAPLEAPQLGGEVGLSTNVAGAFVRVLHHGRLLAAAEPSSLAPLRLRAVVDLLRPLGDSYFEGDADKKVLGLVHKHVEQAATRAVVASLPRAEALPHALDLLTWLVAQHGVTREDLSAAVGAETREALRKAPLFPCLGRPATSLAELSHEMKWQYVRAPQPHGLLDESRVLVLDPQRLELLQRIARKRLEDVGARLEQEQEIRRRLEGPREAPEVSDAFVKVALEGAELRGEVGIPERATKGLSLNVLRNGIRLETTQLSATYHHAVASVDCPALMPTSRWSVVRDETWSRMLAAVQTAERRVVAELVKRPRAGWPAGAELTFQAFLKKELRGFSLEQLDEVTRAVVDAPLFDAGARRVSLRELKTRGEFWSLPLDAGRPDIPDELVVLFEPPSLLALLGEVVGWQADSAVPELQRREARRRVERLPLARFELARPVEQPLELVRPHFRARFGVRPDPRAEASVRLVIAGRQYAQLTVPCALPLEVVLSLETFEPAPDLQLTDAQRAEVQQCTDALVLEVLANDMPPRLALLALGRHLDARLPPPAAEALRRRPLFPCTDGELRSLSAVSSAEPRYVRRAQEGALPDGLPIIVADTPAVLVALERWPQAKAVDELLAAQRDALARREALAPAERIVARVDSPWRQALTQEGVEGEVVVAREGAGRVELYLERRPLCVVEGVLEGPFAAAVDAHFTPTPLRDGVVRDDRFQRVMEVISAASERLAAALATVDVPDGWHPVMTQLAFSRAEARAWEWKGRKKGKKKTKGRAVEPSSGLLAAPLLRDNAGGSLSLEALVTWQHEQGRVAVVTRGGRFLEPGRRAWWPRAQEDELAKKLGLVLDDRTAELALAESIRARPKYERLDAPIASEWREPVRGAGLEGELALEPVPSETLIIEVLFERVLLERYATPHRVGGVARVSSTAISPNADWSGARRDAHFKDLVVATEAALERVVHRRLAQHDGLLSRWGRAALRWRFGQATLLSADFPGLPLFRALDGTPVTVGAVLQLAQRAKKVAVASPRPGLEAVKDVLLDGADTRATLEVLGLELDDVSNELVRSADLKRALTARRLSSLTWKGEALVRVTVDQPLEGELALARAPGEVMLARDGIAVSPLETKWPGVVGVLGVPELPVDAGWTKATPTRAQSALIRAQVERLYVALAERVRDAAQMDREQAAAWALRFLAQCEVSSLGDLDRLSGAAKVLAEAPLFSTVDGERVSLRAVAAEMLSAGRVAVFERAPGRVSSCVLQSSSFEAAWLVALEALFGKNRVWRVSDVRTWERIVREADPPEGTPLLEGLRTLRKQVRLLRAGALGHLTPDDLEEVRLTRDGGDVPMRYDAERKLVLLDPSHPDVARALEESATRPERLWILVAACFGLVNRALQHVTDHDEAQLLIALAAHLGRNPKLLEPERPTTA